MLKRRDEGIGKINFVDIASPAYDPQENAGISYQQVSEDTALQPQEIFDEASSSIFKRQCCMSFLHRH